MLIELKRFSKLSQINFPINIKDEKMKKQKTKQIIYL